MTTESTTPTCFGADYVTRRFSLSVLVLLAVVTVSCDLLKEKKPVVHRKKAPIAASAAPSSSNSTAPHDAHASSASSAHGSAHGESTPGERNKFALPFAWELGENEPLAKTKGFVREMLRDNRDYMKHGPQVFRSVRQSPEAESNRRHLFRFARTKRRLGQYARERPTLRSETSVTS